jgi:hypothetical protein
VPTVPDTRPRLREVAKPPGLGSRQEFQRSLEIGGETAAPGVSDLASARDAYLSGAQILPALREGRIGDAVKAFLASTAAAVGTLPMVPSVVGMTKALRQGEAIIEPAASVGRAQPATGYKLPQRVRAEPHPNGGHVVTWGQGRGRQEYWITRSNGGDDPQAAIDTALWQQARKQQRRTNVPPPKWAVKEAAPNEYDLVIEGTAEPVALPPPAKPASERAAEGLGALADPAAWLRGGGS